MNGTKTMEWLKCNICFNVYDDAKLRPRSLSCGHTFCEGCLKSTLQNEFLICPQCRKTHEIKSVLDLPVNFTLEGILKSLNTSSQDISEVIIEKGAKEESTLDSRRGACNCLCSLVDHQQKDVSEQEEVLKISSGRCHDHPNMECMYRCSTHMCWVCKKCIEDVGNHSEDKCKIISFREEIVQRKQEYLDYLVNEKDFCDRTLSLMQKHILYLAHEKERHITLGNKLKDLVVMHEKEEENLQNDINYYQKHIEKGKAVKEELLEDEKSIMNVATLDEANAARDLVNDKKEVARNWINTSQRDVFVGKLKIAQSTLAVLSEKSLRIRENEQLDNNMEMKSSETVSSEGVECGVKHRWQSFFYRCLQCRATDNVVLCGTCFVNSEHANHIHEIDWSSSWTCDCGVSKCWKSNATCMIHLQNEEDLSEPFVEDSYPLSKCAEIFYQGEKTFSCLDCRSNKDYILCGSCFVNSEHKNHTYEIVIVKGDKGFCNCGIKKCWKSEDTCKIHKSHHAGEEFFFPKTKYKKI